MSTPTSVQNAPPPFSSPDSQPELGLADFIIRSSDKFDFFVHKETLGAASDFFGGMFSVPQAEGAAGADLDSPNRDGIPVLVLDEPKLVLLRVLKLAYRTTPPKPAITLKNLDDIIKIQQVVDKYQFTRVDQMLASAAPSDLMDLLGASDPLRMFVIAMLCGYTQAAQLAMRIAVRRSIDLFTVDFPEMRLLTWPQGKEIEKLCQIYTAFVGVLLKAQTGYKPKEIEPLGLRAVHFRRVMSPSTPGATQNPAVPNPMPPAPMPPQPHMPQGGQVVFVWWQPEGHAATCLAAHTSFQRSKTLSIGADTPLACTILSRPTAWFEDHIKRLARGDLLTWTGRHLPDESPVPALVDMAPEVQQAMRRCRFCAGHVQMHLKLWGEQVAKDLADMDAYLDSNVDRMVAM
uniref:BTB domain-containing protein n=1 Tax=Mycena chlorophos TaxID=658473 RepID=A0ABQ0LEN9_MYCCL|nr:predicted protein [Mycena chlorophos]